MARNSLVINSRFKPFSYDELVRPLEASTMAHREMEERYTGLQEQSSLVSGRLDQEIDQAAYQRAMAYENELKANADLLASQGLNSVSRRNLNKLRAQFQSDINPIASSLERRRQLVDEQRQLSLNDPTRHHSLDFGRVSIDDLIANPEMGYKSISGAQIQNNVMQAAGALARSMRDEPRKWYSILNGTHYETMMQQGYKPEEILAVIMDNGDISKFPELSAVMEQAVAQSGVHEWGDGDMKNAALGVAYDSAKMGLWQAIGQTNYTNLQNPYAVPRAGGPGPGKDETTDPKRLDYDFEYEPANTKKKRELRDELYVDGKPNSKYFDKDGNLLENIIKEEWVEEKRGDVYKRSKVSVLSKNDLKDKLSSHGVKGLTVEDIENELNEQIDNSVRENVALNLNLTNYSGINKHLDSKVANWHRNNKYIDEGLDGDGNRIDKSKFLESLDSDITGMRFRVEEGKKLYDITTKDGKFYTLPSNWFPFIDEEARQIMSKYNFYLNEVQKNPYLTEDEMMREIESLTREKNEAFHSAAINSISHFENVVQGQTGPEYGKQK